MMLKVLIHVDQNFRDMPKLDLSYVCFFQKWENEQIHKLCYSMTVYSRVICLVRTTMSHELHAHGHHDVRLKENKNGNQIKIVNV